MSVPLVDLKANYRSIKNEIDAAIQAVIEEAAFIGLPANSYVRMFEEEFARFLGVRHCMACANGTDAIEILLRAYGIGPGDEVLVPANTWISTAEAVSANGALPVFVDSHPDYYTMDVERIAERASERTRAIIPVHLYGQTVDMDPLLALARERNWTVIEDCAQAHGALYRGRMAGTMGHAATFSFFPGKNLGAFGDAGGMATNDDTIAEKARMIANHGRLGKFDHGLEGRNSRMDGIQAAILSVKLKHLPAWTDLRRQKAALYDARLADVDLKLPARADYARHVFHLYVVQVAERDRVIASLQENGIATGVHYPVALPFLQAYRVRGFRPDEYPVSYAAMTGLLSLPIYPELDEAVIDRIARVMGRAIPVRS